jgi:hypothetical protein
VGIDKAGQKSVIGGVNNFVCLVILAKVVGGANGRYLRSAQRHSAISHIAYAVARHREQMRVSD